MVSAAGCLIFFPNFTVYQISFETVKFGLESWPDTVEVSLVCNTKKLQAAMQWNSSAFQWSVSSWAFSKPNNDACVAHFIPSVTKGKIN